MRLSRYIMENARQNDEYEYVSGSYKGVASRENIVRRSKVSSVWFDISKLKDTNNEEMLNLGKFLNRLNFTGEVKYTVATPNYPSSKIGYKLEYKRTSGTITYIGLKLKTEEQKSMALEYGFTLNKDIYEYTCEPQDMEIVYKRDKSQLNYRYDAEFDVADLNAIQKYISGIKVNGKTASSRWVKDMIQAIKSINEPGTLYINQNSDGVDVIIVTDELTKQKSRDIVGRGLYIFVSGVDKIYIKSNNLVILGEYEKSLEADKLTTDHMDSHYSRSGKYQGD